MPKPGQHTSDQVLDLTGIKKSRLSQLVNGYTTSRGTSVPPVLEEGIHYTWERREVQGPKRLMKKHVLLFTEAGLERIKEETAKPPGRPRKET